MNFQNKKDLEHKIISLYLFLVIFEGMVSAFILLTNPSEPKNILFLGYSLYRLLLLAAIIFLLVGAVYSLINQKIIPFIIRFILSTSRKRVFGEILGILFLLSLWVTVWFPAERMGTGEANLIRLQPVLIFFELVGAQFFLIHKFIRQEIHFQEVFQVLFINKKVVWLCGAFIFFSAVLFRLLSFFPTRIIGVQFYVFPGAPISGFQVFSGWLILLIILFLEKQKFQIAFLRTNWVWGTFFFIWVSAIFLIFSTPLVCVDDRPGPFPPNNICYPQINDAVFSIGSHYISLGQGIYHHWLTDKPLYMVFLAIGQMVFGPSIDQYLLIQVIVLALIPAFLFLLGKKMMSYSGGLFLAFLALIQQINAIKVYRQVGSVNIKFENSELLTSLVLILLFFSVFNWIKTPHRKIWSILSGGLLGVSTLIRFNPIFIFPVLILFFGFVYRKKFRSFLVPLCLFLLAFILIFLPWFLSARNVRGNNFYVEKVKEVINSRFLLKSDFPKPQIKQNPATNSTPTPAAKGTEKQPQTILNYPKSSQITDRYSGVFLHLLNNGYTSLAKLPTEAFFVSIDDQVKGPIWDVHDFVPIWKIKIPTLTLLVLLVNLIIIVLGVAAAVKKFGTAGISGLLIQSGYYIGNSISQTSGGRYLEPVIWVTLLYYVMGIFYSTTLLLEIFRSNHPAQTVTPRTIATTVIKNPEWKETKPVLLGLIAFLSFGLLLPIFNNLPNKMTAENNPYVEQAAFTALQKTGAVSSENWQQFIADPNKVIVSGFAYQPRYYRSTFFMAGTKSFELMLLTNNRVVISYLTGLEPSSYYSDESKTILVGCRLGIDHLWGSNRMIIRTYAVIQLDHEKNILIDPDTSWNCDPN